MGGRAPQICSQIVIQDRKLPSAMDRYDGLLLAAAVAMAYACIITYSPRSSHLFSEQCARVAAATTRGFGTGNNTTCGNDTPALYEPLGVSYPPAALIDVLKKCPISRKMLPAKLADPGGQHLRGSFQVLRFFMRLTPSSLQSRSKHRDMQ